VTVEEGVPVNVRADVAPEQTGLVAATDAVSDEVTVMTKFKTVTHPFSATCVSVIVVPAGQELPKLRADGDTIALPPGGIPKVLEPPDEVVHDTTAFGVPLTVNPLVDPGQRVPGAVAVGAGFTVMVPLAVAVPQPPVSGIE